MAPSAVITDLGYGHRAADRRSRGLLYQDVAGKKIRSRVRLAAHRRLGPNAAKGEEPGSSGRPTSSGFTMLLGGGNVRRDLPMTPASDFRRRSFGWSRCLVR